MKPDIDGVMNKFKCTKKVAEQAIQGFENYLNWLTMSNLEVAFTEVELVSEKYKFGGCNDLIFRGNKGLAIGDIKTSSGVYPDYLIQISGYANLWNENHPDDPITGGYHLLRFSKDNADFSHHYWSELDDAWEQFKLFRAAYDLDKKLKKRTG